MAKVIGLGGIFFKTRDSAALAAWYARHLGLDVDKWNNVKFQEDASRPGCTLWTPFAADTTYFGPGAQTFMVNFRVDDLDALLDQLRADGITVERAEDSEFGRFGWVTDPEGTRVELWQPPA
jgi:catechol 2,3-dioxygenase-like lactoylglutathione lyase family enzyme